MRKAMFHLITSDLIVANLIPVEQWFTRSSVPDTPAKPFGVLAWTGRPRQGPGRAATSLSVYVYQERGSYELINLVLDRVEVIMNEVADFSWEGERITATIIEGRSADLYDDQWRANMISLDLRVAGR